MTNEKPRSRFAGAGPIRAILIERGPQTAFCWMEISEESWVKTAVPAQAVADFQPDDLFLWEDGAAREIPTDMEEWERLKKEADRLKREFRDKKSASDSA